MRRRRKIAHDVLALGDTGWIAPKVKRYDERLGQSGRYFKRHPMDCGNPKCGVCHGDKVIGKRRMDERKADWLEAGE